MPTLFGPNFVSDWLKFEAPSYFSRKQITLAQGHGVLVSGTVIGQVTATGKFVPVTATASDGSQTGVAVLLGPAQSIDTTSADQPAVAVVRHAEVGHAGITYDASVNSPTLRAAINAALEAKGIVVRQSA